MILFLHNRYRTTGGEERAVEQLMALVGDQLGEPVELLQGDSAGVARSRAAYALLRGGERPQDVAAAVGRSKARIVHAHNIHPLFGWRSLAAARAAGAKVVLHLHQYRLVCAVGVCFTAGQECTRCHGRNTLPGMLRNCRGSRAEAVSYGTALALWQRRIVENADAVIVPSAFARERLAQLGAPLSGRRIHVLPPPMPMPIPEEVALGGDAGPERATAPEPSYALLVSRLAAEKGIEIAIDACRATKRPLVVAGEGSERERLQGRAQGADVCFLGAVSDSELAALRAGAALALVPSRAPETFGIAAAEAMAAGLPVAASRIGALPELLGAEALVPPGDELALADAIERLWADRRAGEQNRERIAGICAPEVVAKRLAEVYDGLGAA